MNRVFRRYLATKPLPAYKGCRMLDYCTPATHFSVPKSSHLLQSHSGQRYQDGSHYNEQPELATIAMFLARKAKNSKTSETPHIWPILRRRLRISPLTSWKDFNLAALPEPPERTHLEKWIDCVSADTLSAATDIILNNPGVPWPAFVLLYTLSRHPQSRLDVYNAVRCYEQHVDGVPSHYRIELTKLAINLAQTYLLDLVPAIVRAYLSTTSQLEHDPAAINELLWQIARYGRRWSDVDIPILLEAQELLIKAAGSDVIDAKGVFALGYVTHFNKPETARAFMEEWKSKVPSRAPKQNADEFAYTCGPLAIKLLTSSSVDEALAVVDQVSVHKPAMWTCAALYLSRNRMLSSGTALKLWNRARKTGVRPTALLLEVVLGSVHSFDDKLKILSQALGAGLRLTANIVAKMAKVKTINELDQFRSSFPQYLDNEKVLQQILGSQRICEPENVWQTYYKLYPARGIMPSREALYTLCRCAWNTKLVWDDMYAAQRAYAEFKMHVRGVAAPSSDILRIYPDERLLYAYLVMLGRCGYTDDLLSFLGWLEGLSFEPSKRMLAALIYYSPQGPALLKLGQNTSPPASNWPTQEEYELYTNMLENK